MRSNTDGVIHVWLHLVTTTPAGTWTGAVDAGVDRTRPRRNFGPIEPGNSGTETLSTATGSAIPERPGPVRIFFLAPPDSQERRLRWTDTKLTIISAKISFKKDDDFTGILCLDLLDGDADLRRARQRDGGVLPAVNVSWDPGVDPSTALTTVGDGPPLVRRFRDSGERRPEQRERSVSGERADEATVSQLDSNVLVDSLSVLISGRVVDRSISRTRVVQEAKIPAVCETEDQFSTIKISDKHPIPWTGVDRPVTERHASAVHVAPAGGVRPDTYDNVDEISNESRT